MKKRLPKIYSDRIVDHIFKHLYTKTLLFKEELNISRPTATRYLKMLEAKGFLVTEKVGKELVYKNVHLSNIFN